MLNWPKRHKQTGPNLYWWCRTHCKNWVDRRSMTVRCWLTAARRLGVWQPLHTLAMFKTWLQTLCSHWNEVLCICYSALHPHATEELDVIFPLACIGLARNNRPYCELTVAALRCSWDTVGLLVLSLSPAVLQSALTPSLFITRHLAGWKWSSELRSVSKVTAIPCKPLTYAAL